MVWYCSSHLCTLPWSKQPHFDNLLLSPFSYRDVGKILGNLHGIAVDMGDELERQNLQLERITEKADLNVDRLGDAKRRIQKQL